MLRNLSQGMAGVLLTLAEFVTQQNTSSLRSTLRDGAYWLMQSERLGGPILPGLYSGEAGVGIALLRAGQLLEDQVLISAAEKQGQLIATCPYDLPDLMHGTAGRLKYHIWLWQATARSYHLQAALQAGCTLLEQAEDIEDGGMGWKISAGYYGAAGRMYIWGMLMEWRALLMPCLTSIKQVGRLDFSKLYNE
nr:lanthionine synthetase LanC family protein [Ktedonosporobacter rubrisoli]